MGKIRRAMQVIFLVALASQMLTACGDGLARWPATHFDRAKWMQANEDNRFVFARDLIEHKKLIGLSRPQAIDLLGTPSFDDPNGEYMTYILKTDSDGVHLLDIRFAKNQKGILVESVFIRSA
jgi:hypothetical protein